jgi:hypothetical protein
MDMKKILQKMAVVWLSMLTLVGFTKTKVVKMDKEERRNSAIQREIILDEFEFSAFHSN